MNQKIVIQVKLKENDFSSCSKLKIKFSFDINKYSQKSHINLLFMIKEIKTNLSELFVANYDFSYNIIDSMNQMYFL